MGSTDFDRACPCPHTRIRIVRNELSIAGALRDGLAESAGAREYIHAQRYPDSAEKHFPSGNPMTGVSRVQTGCPDARVIVKAFGLGRHRRRIHNAKYDVRMQFRGYARSSYGMALRLLDAGICAPQPIAWWNVHRRGRCVAQYYMYRYVDHALTLTEYADRYVRSADAARSLIGEYARFVARVHETGFRHGDLGGDNILVTGAGDERRYWLIDLDDAGPVPRSMRAVGLWLERRDFRRIDLPAFRWAVADPHRLFISRYRASRNGSAPDAWYRYWLKRR